MSSVYFNLSSGDFFQDWSNTGLIAADDNWNNVPSIVGYRGDDVTAGTGTNPTTLTAGGTGEVVDVNANQANPNTFNTGGVAEFEIANPTVALTGSGTADAPFIVLFLNASGRQNLVFSVNLRDLDGSADNAQQQVAVQYRIGASGAWTNLDGGYVADATTGPSLATQVTPLSIALPAAVDNQPQVQVRIITTNAVGNDEYVGIDDIRVASQPLPTSGPGSLSIADASVAEGDEGGAAALAFTVTRAGGLSGAVTADYSVTFDTANADDLAPGAPLAGTVSFADGETSKTITLAVRGDVVTEANETLGVTLSAPTGGAGLTDAAAVGTITNDDVSDTPIFAIQGAGHRSAFAGQTVTTTGVVTAVDTNGFYLQDPTGDGDVRTSDAILVFTSTAPGVTVGQTVRVSGTVQEFLPANNNGNLTVTQLNASAAAGGRVAVTGTGEVAATVIGRGGRLPPTELIEDDGFTAFQPTSDGLDFYESLEGMLVTVRDAQVVANSNDFGETFVVADRGADVTASAGQPGLAERGGVSIGANDFNPERLQIDDDDGLFNTDLDFTQGDRLGDVTGVISYSFQSYELLVTRPIGPVADVTVNPETTALLAGDKDHLTVATYNLLNLDPRDPQAKFDALAQDIVAGLRAPDVLAVQEIQDADGAGNGNNFSGQATAQKLIDAIVAAGGPRYSYAEIAPAANNSTGGEPNGNIRNGFLFNPERTSLVDGSLQLIQADAFAGTRRPLVGDFLFNGEAVTLVNVHFTSRGGSSALTGAVQPQVLGGESARVAQSAAVRDFVLSLGEGKNVAVLGDFNGFYFEPVSNQIESAGLTNLLELLPAAERYSYSFEGNLQALDNLLVSTALLDGVQFDAVHRNSDVADAAARPTDHDPLLARLFIPNDAPNPVTLTGGAVAENAPAGAAAGTVAAPAPAGGRVLYSLVGGVVDQFVVDAATGALTTRFPLDFEVGATRTLVVRATDPDGAFTDAEVQVAVANVNEAPTATVDAVAVAEDATSANLYDLLLGNDADPDAGTTLSIGAVNGSGTLGSLVFDAASRTLRYVADADAFDGLALGAIATDRFAYTVTDEGGLTSTAVVTVTVTGVADGITVTGGGRDDLLDGTGGEDVLSGGNGADRLRGLDGQDRLDGGNGDDTLDGGAGQDTLSGGNGVDRLFGGAGRDQLEGGNGDDRLDGGAGADLLSGGNGADLLFGGAGDDRLVGGTGANRFLFAGGGGRDVIADYRAGDDQLVLDGVMIAGRRTADVDGDGRADLILLFDDGGEATLLGVADFAQVAVVQSPGAAGFAQEQFVA